MSDNIKVILIGVGYMGREYAKVLKARGNQIIPLGRGNSNAQRFEQEFGIEVYLNGIENAIKSDNLIPEYAIIAVNVPDLCQVTLSCIGQGIKNILVEKPAGLGRKEIEKITEEAEKRRVNVFVAYNRRFYASVERALQIIKEDGGVSSFHFEFTEWPATVEKTDHSALIKNNWMLCNSTHVIDLAFYLGGKPKDMCSYLAGENELIWHSRCSSYVGAGETVNGALFTYQANWNAPGRWGIEILTRKHRLYFRPMETLQIQKMGSVKIEQVDLGKNYDLDFKPGLYQQVSAFLENQNDNRLIRIGKHLENFDIYQKIENI